MHRYSVAIMVDTEGSEVHTNELEQPIKAEVGFKPACSMSAQPCIDAGRSNEGFAGFVAY